MPTLNTTNRWMRETIDGYDCYVYETGPTSFYTVMQKQTGEQRGKWIANLRAGPLLAHLHGGDGETWCYYDTVEAAKAAVMELHAVDPVDSLIVEMRPDGLLQLLA